MNDAMAAIPLQDSTICRLCAEENDNGEYLFTGDSGETDLSAMINRYLPLKVYNDGKLPRTICPGCNIQLEATAQFFELLINGQRKIFEMFKKQNKLEHHFKSNTLSLDQNSTPVCSEDDQGVSNLNVQQFTSNADADQPLFAPDHELSAQIEVLENKPKKKRGRPCKTAIEESEVPHEDELLQINNEVSGEKHTEEELDGEGRQKRIRKIPKRFMETVQGKEFEKIFKKEIFDEVAVEPRDEVGKNVLTSEKAGGEDTEELIPVNNSKNGTGVRNQKILQMKKKEKFSCPYCDEEFSQRSKYIVHKSFHKVTKYECAECCCQFSSSEKLSLHQKATLHSGKKKIEVNDVELERDFKAGLGVAPTKKAQQSSTANAVPAQCLKEASSRNAASLETAEGVEEMEDGENGDFLEFFDTKGIKSTFKCTKCNKHYMSEDSLENHIKVVHQGEKPFTCELCYKTFGYKSSLEGHMEIVHQTFQNYGSNGNFCDLCGKQFSDSNSVLQHKIAEHDRNHRFFCNICGKSFKHKQLLHRHQLVHSEDRPYPCESCDASFKTKANLLNHQSTHTGEKKFYCELCDQKFAHKTSLTLHYRTHTGQKPYKCEFCPKSFSQNGNLQEHLRIHTGEKPYCCDHCGRKFTTSSQFKLHVKRHTGERPWKCDFCEKSFLHKDTWKCHVRRHTGERPFQCTECKRNFTEQWALKKHMRLHTGEKPYSCDICSKTFADCSNLTKHKKVHKNHSEPGVQESSKTTTSSKVFQGSPNSRVGEDSFNNGTATDENSEEDTSQIFYVSYQDSDLSNDAARLQFGKGGIDDQDAESVINENIEDPIGVELPEELPESNIRLEITDEDGNAIPLSIQEARQLLSDGQIVSQSARGQTIRIQGLPDSIDEMSLDTEMIPEISERSPTLKSSLTPIQTDAELIRVLEDEDTETVAGNQDEKLEMGDSQQTIEFITQDGQKVRLLAPINLDALQLASNYFNTERI